jgi:hypothetical protein
VKRNFINIRNENRSPVGATKMRLITAAAVDGPGKNALVSTSDGERQLRQQL